MALAERTVEVAKEGDVTVGKITHIIVDEKTGVVAQKETIAMEVPDGRGGTNVIVAERLRAVKMVMLDYGNFPFASIFVFNFYSQIGFNRSQVRDMHYQ